jgi:citrate lyase subunit beta/citryl-CoA lyase
VNVPPVTWLYVPGNRPDRVEKAIASRAHAVIVDLEDGVEPTAKDAARAGLPALLGEPRAKPIFVRVNAGSDADLDLAAMLAIDGIILPKVVSTADIPSRAGLDDLRFQALIESPAGLEAAYEIARHPKVRGISLGESDLRSATGALEAGLDWPRGRIVNAAVAAGLPRPPQSVYPDVRDLVGLAESCRRGRALGHLGRAAIHPDQLEVIEQTYVPGPEEVERARATVERLSAGAGTLASGEFVDAAMLAGAQQTLAIAELYG